MRAIQPLHASVGRRHRLGPATLAAFGLEALLPLAASAAATLASVTLNAGTLAFINGTPAATVAFPSVTLNGTDQTVTAPLSFDVGDATGSAVGWDVAATSTTFTSGTHTLPDVATTISSAPTAACDPGAPTCTSAATTVSFPYTLPAAATPPPATKLFDAAAGTGMGNQTFAAMVSLAIPASVTAGGTYTSTWTFSLVSGP
jgi:hypothetical protein